RAPARPALHVWKPLQPLMLIPAFYAVVHVLWTRDAGRAGAHPYHATRTDYATALRSEPGEPTPGNRPNRIWSAESATEIRFASVARQSPKLRMTSRVN